MTIEELTKDMTKEQVAEFNRLRSGGPSKYAQLQNQIHKQKELEKLKQKK